MTFGKVPAFVLDRNLSSMFGRGGRDGQEFSPLTKRERSLFLVNREVSRALFFLDKLEGRLFCVLGVEDLPGDLFFSKR